MTAAESENQTSHVSGGAEKPADGRRLCKGGGGLTGVGGPEVVGVAGEEGLVVLRRQVHVVVSERLSTCDPRVPAQARTAHLESTSSRIFSFCSTRI